MPHTIYNSPWPFIISLNVAFTAINLIQVLHGVNNTYLSFNAIVLILSCYAWMRDFNRESLGGFYGKALWNTLFLSFAGFLLSECFYFVALFWCLISNMCVPTLGGWPSSFIHVHSGYLGVLGTLLLIGSSFVATGAHHYARLGNRWASAGLLALTILMGITFIHVSHEEFSMNRFTFTDGVYGSIYYMLLGTHLFHVILGVLALTLSCYLVIRNRVVSDNSVLLDCSVYYWHFVDLVWLFVYGILY